MAFDVGLFRTTFPEFANTVAYPNEQIQFWAGLAELQVLECVWKRALIYGQSLYIAHEITLAALNAKAAAVGGTPGTSGGIANTKTVGQATIGYDSNTNTEKDAGYWNLTNYGKQFIRMARLFGAGPRQL